MRKRLFAGLLTLVMILSLVPMPALAVENVADGEDGVMPLDNSSEEILPAGTSGGVDWKFENGILTISKASNPEQGYTAGEMKVFQGNGHEGHAPDGTCSEEDCNTNRPWYYLKDQIQSVIVDEGVTVIGQNTFLGTSVKTVTLPSTVTEIGPAAFGSCSQLSTVNFASTATSLEIEAYAFNGAALTTLELPAYITSIGDSAFLNNTSLTTLVFNGTSDINLGKNIFAGCTSLTSVDVKSVSTIGERMFYGCTALSSLTLSNTVKTIEKQAFQNCSALKQVILPDSVEALKEQAFAPKSQDSQLEIIKFGAGLTTVSQNLLQNQTGLKVLDLSEIDADKLPATGENGQRNDNLVGIYTKSGKSEGVSFYLPDADYLVWRGNIEYNESGNTNINSHYYFLLNSGTVKSYVTDLSNSMPDVEKDGYRIEWYEYKEGSDYSNEQSVTSATPGNVYYAKWMLDAPTVTVSADKSSIVKNSGSAALTATAQHEAEGVTYEYQWYKGTPDSGTEISGATGQTYEVNNLTSDTTYYCKVIAVNGSDKSEAATSDTVTISVANAEGSVAITNDKTAATYGDDPFTFTYTSSGTATVESSDTSVATVSDNNGTVTVTIVGAGSATISVSSAASAEYTAASAEFTLTVAKATLTAPELTKYTATTTSITVTAPTVPAGASKVQYSIDNGANWQDSNVFSGLTSGTSYSVIARFVADNSGNYADSADSTALSVRTNSVGTSHYPTVQKPVIETSEGVTASLNSTGTIATITVADGYELADVTVNGVSKGAVTTLTGLKTGDKVVVTAKKTEEPPAVDDSARIKAGVQATTLKIYSKSLNTKGSGKGWIQVRWVKSKGFKVDGYELYRGKTKSTMKRYDTTTKTTYTNKNYLKKGSRYYYKVRGYRMINGEKVYTQWSKTIYRLAK